MGYGWGMGGGIGMIVFWIALILAIVWLVRVLDHGKLGTGSETASKGDRALEILRERHARGEIESEEFERRKSDLTRKEPQ